MKIEYLASLPDVITKEIFNHFSDEDLDDLYKQAVRLKLPVYPYKNIPTFQKVRQLWKKDAPKTKGTCFTRGCNNSAEYFVPDQHGGFCENCIHIREHYVWLLTSAYRDSTAKKHPRKQTAKRQPKTKEYRSKA